MRWRFDAPFWALLIGSLVFVGSAAAIGFAAAAMGAARSDAAILVSDDITDDAELPR